MLTVQQSDILSLLADFKCLRRSHVEKYIVAKYASSADHLSRMLKQLGYLGKIREIDGFVSFPGRKINPSVIEAFDVVIALTDGCLEFIYPGSNPFILTFTVKNGHDDSSLTAFGVTLVETGDENAICGRLRNIGRVITVIFILRDSVQRKSIEIENKHYFAARDDHGNYKFFKAANQPRK